MLERRDGWYCASPEMEGVAQPVRLAAGAIGGPAVVFLATQLPEDRPTLRLAGIGLGLACSVWNLSVWNAVRKM